MRFRKLKFLPDLRFQYMHLKIGIAPLTQLGGNAARFSDKLLAIQRPEEQHVNFLHAPFKEYRPIPDRQTLLIFLIVLDTPDRDTDLSCRILS
jgi:hypothetical protein